MSPGRDRGSVGNHNAVLRRSGLRCTRLTGLPAAAGRGRVRTIPGVHQRYLKSSKIVTTNRSISECGQVLGDTTVAAALLARHGCSGQVPAKAAVIARQYSVGRCPVVRLTARPGRLSAPTPTGPRWVRKSRPGVGMMCPSSYQQADYIAFWAVSLSLAVVCQSAGPTRAGGSATLERSTISISSPHGVRK